MKHLLGYACTLVFICLVQASAPVSPLVGAPVPLSIEDAYKPKPPLHTPHRPSHPKHNKGNQPDTPPGPGGFPPPPNPIHHHHHQSKNNKKPHPAKVEMAKTPVGPGGNPPPPDMTTTRKHHHAIVGDSDPYKPSHPTLTPKPKHPMEPKKHLTQKPAPKESEDYDLPSNPDLAPQINACGPSCVPDYVDDAAPTSKSPHSGRRHGHGHGAQPPSFPPANMNEATNDDNGDDDGDDNEVQPVSNTDDNTLDGPGLWEFPTSDHVDRNGPGWEFPTTEGDGADATDNLDYPDYSLPENWPGPGYEPPK